MKYKVEVRDVAKVYKRGKTEFRALDGISLMIKGGEFLSLSWVRAVPAKAPCYTFWARSISRLQEMC